MNAKTARADSGGSLASSIATDATDSSSLRHVVTPLASRQVSWWEVHEFVSPLLNVVGPYPAVGTPAWCLLPASDVRKIAAVFDAARHWALRVETVQETLAEASRDIAAVDDGWRGWKPRGAAYVAREAS